MGYTLAYTGAEIDALLGKIDAIFVAEYGSTIYSEVTAAIAAGNKVIVANAGKVFVYAGPDDNSGYVFTQSGPNAAKPNATYVTLSTGNVWSTATVDLATLQQFYASFMEDTASGSIASFPDGANGVPVAELSVEIVPVQSGSGDPSPDNIRPISGWTGAEISVTGINVWDEEWESGGYSNDTGAKISDTDAIRSKNPISVKPSTSYYYKSTAGVRLFYYDADYNYISTEVAVNTSKTTPSNAYFVNFRTGSSASPVTTYNHDISINYPSTDHDYHSGADNTTYSVSWTDEGTVYKGTAEYKGGGEWEITKTHESVDMGTLTWTKFTWNYKRAYYTSISGRLNGSDMLSSMFKYIGVRSGAYTEACIANESASNEYIDAYDPAYDSADATAAQFTTAVTGQKLVYELATPVTFTVTGPAPETLLGDNNMWTSTNGDISVKYRANTALYIEKKLGE